MTNKEIILKLISLVAKTLLLIFLVANIIIQLSERIVTPIMPPIQFDKTAEIKGDLKSLVPDLSEGYAEEVSQSIKIASEATKINDKVITSVAYYESKMKPNVVSSAGYKGIMQATKHDKYEFAVVDIMRGAKKLENWIQYRKGNLRYALASYNGGTNPPKKSFDYAEDVIRLTKKLEKRGEK